MEGVGPGKTKANVLFNLQPSIMFIPLFPLIYSKVLLARTMHVRTKKKKLVI